MTAYRKQDGGAGLSLLSRYILVSSANWCHYSAWYSIIIKIVPSRMRGVGGGAWWMTDRDGFGHSQEVVWSASGHMGLAAARGGVKLKAGGERERESVWLVTDDITVRQRSKLTEQDRDWQLPWTHRSSGYNRQKRLRRCSCRMSELSSETWRVQDQQVTVWLINKQLIDGHGTLSVTLFILTKSISECRPVPWWLPGFHSGSSSLEH